MASKDQVIIVGGGLAGLCCARTLHSRGVPFTLLEASNAVGGRVRTDYLDGYTLDRGFQIFLTAYPEAQDVLDYGKLDFKPFSPGALIRSGGSFHKLSDPFRCPIEALPTLLSPVGTISDKLKIALLRQKLLSSNGNGTVNGTQQSTRAALEDFGFSRSMIEQFFRPFLGGIFLDPKLETSESVFNFVFRMLANGDNVLPARGMQTIPMQIAESLPSESIKLMHQVATLTSNSAVLSSGEVIEGNAIVIATEEPQCRRLLGLSAPSGYKSETCVYFSADKAPLEQPILVLNGDTEGPVANFVIPSNVSPSYAPKGKALLSAVITSDISMNDDDLKMMVRKQLRGWFGSKVDEWQHLRTYRIKYALPDQTPGSLAAVDRSYRPEGRTYICGDYKETGSINGAMISGRRAAEALINDLGL